MYRATANILWVVLFALGVLYVLALFNVFVLSVEEEIILIVITFSLIYYLALRLFYGKVEEGKKPKKMYVAEVKFPDVRVRRL